MAMSGTRELSRRAAPGTLGWRWNSDRANRTAGRLPALREGSAMASASRRRPWRVAPGGLLRGAPADAARVTPRTEVDVALVLAVDSSGSISEQRLMMQIQGYLDALRHPSFIDAVRGGRHGRIALTFIEWTDARRQDQVVGWRVIEDEAGAHAFAQAIHDALRPLPGWTSISAAIDFSRRAVAQQRLLGRATGHRHLRRRRQQRRPAGYRGARRRRGRRGHRSMACRSSRSSRNWRPITGRTSSAGPMRSSSSRGIPAASARPCCGSCWSRLPASSRPTWGESGRRWQNCSRQHHPANAARTVAASSCLRYGLRSIAPG